MKSNLEIIRRPLVTEKVTRLQAEYNQYVFEVDPRSNKIEIKRAVEERFDVKVTKVRTINVSGKVKTLGRFSGRRTNWKKAIVTLAEGDNIELFEGG
ncbi:MAG: 50S ribosomal protein L23 [Candidatus Hatepunaea meridiana]|nr:50S ribosomal protein L23 [Candidatus Hatepunaea meridiana]